MRSKRAEHLCITLPRAALVAIFDECDRFEEDETGGRVLGTYAKQADNQLSIAVTGILGPGPDARRSAVSFVQDGEYQERIFRDIERSHPSLEHLGNWHTHHVNGYPTLSGGDIATYKRIVNHKNHNTSFFYALLVVAKHRNTQPHERYAVKHFVLRRGDDHVYEIPHAAVDVVDAPLVWPETQDRETTTSTQPTIASAPAAQPERVYDRDILADFFPGLRPFTSPRLGVYWRGLLELISNSRIEIVVIESSAAPRTTYSVALREPPAELKTTAEEIAKHEFPSARAAAIATERICNRALYEQLRAIGDRQSPRMKGK